MEFNINEEIANAAQEYQNAMEKFFIAKGRLEYLQNIAQRLQQEIQENHNGVIAQQAEKSFASSDS